MGDSILPQVSVKTKGPGVTGPDYSFADAIPFPSDIGVRDGGDMDSVIGAARGVAYYADMIGFGGPSSAMDQNMGMKPVGVQFWMKTGFQCSNGADMWTYVNGIPTGNALGKTMARGLAAANLPALKGLAPGMLEDIESALDPYPIMSSVFGTGSPSCKLVKESVGDQNGKIYKLDENGKKVYYIENPETVTVENGMSYQSRWALDHYVSQSEWDKVAKTFCPDGSKKVGGKCRDVESFCGSGRGAREAAAREAEERQMWKQMVLLGAAAVGIVFLTFAVRKRR